MESKNGFEKRSDSEEEELSMNYSIVDIIPLTPSETISLDKSDDSSSDATARSPLSEKKKTKKSRKIKYNIRESDIRIGNIVGKGADGVVYRGVYNYADVAIKEFKKSEVSEKNIINEIATLQEISPHPNVVMYIGACQVGDSVMIIQDLADCSLLSLRASMSLKEKKFAMKDVSAGMYHLHRQSPPVIHRDLACRNVLRGRDNRFKVADFGISRWLSAESDEHVTTTKTGPVRWMAPEALLHQVSGRKTDVWSFGVTVYETVKCEMPYKGIPNHNIGGHVEKCVKKGKSPVSILSKKKAGTLARVMRACVRIDPSKRPSFRNILTDYFDTPEYKDSSRPEKLALAKTLGEYC
jgi:serine/threonine protein kinase